MGVGFVGYELKVENKIVFLFVSENKCFLNEKRNKLTNPSLLCRKLSFSVIFYNGSLERLMDFCYPMIREIYF